MPESKRKPKEMQTSPSISPVINSVGNSTDSSAGNSAGISGGRSFAQSEQSDFSAQPETAALGSASNPIPKNTSNSKTESKPENYLDYSVVIPVYNSSRALIELVERLSKVFVQQLDASFEIILVNDCSPHAQTAVLLKELLESVPQVTVIQLTRNYGQHAATLCGIGRTSGQTVITMDDDLQHFPEELPKLLAFKDHDIVFGNYEEPKHSAFRLLGSSVKAKLDTVLFNKPKDVKFSSYRIISRPVADYIGAASIAMPYIPALLMQASRDAVSVKIEHGHRAEGVSTYSMRKLLGFFGTMLFNHSHLPLRLISLLGASISGLSFLFTIFLVLKKIFVHTSVTGWTSLIIAILFIGGLTMLSIAVIGEYMVRILAGVEKRPMYVVRKIQSFESKS
jgi:glycosyltransferase involved in cell wall biosynthesis